MISAYGKLPISKEYLRHNCHEGLPLRFRDWMDSGFDYAGSRELAARKGVAQRVFYASSSTKSGIAAVVIPSKDASGTREFPFALLATTTLTQSEGYFASWESRWTELELQFEKLRAESDTDAFFDTVRGLDIPESGPEADTAVAANCSAPSWIDGLYRRDAVDLFVRALWRLRVLQPHLSEAGPELQRVRVPINRSDELGPQIDRWRAILGGLHSAYTGAVSLFCPTPLASPKAKPGGAWLIFDEPRVSDFGAALGGQLEDGKGVDLVDNEGRLPVDGFGAFRERLEAGPLRQEGSIADVLSFDING